MPISLGQVGGSNIASIERQNQKTESAKRDREAGAMQQVMARTTHNSDERRNRQVEIVEASKGQNIKINA